MKQVKPQDPNSVLSPIAGAMSRRAVLGWLALGSGGLLPLALPGCGGGSGGTGGGEAGGEPLDPAARMAALQSVEQRMRTLQAEGLSGTAQLDAIAADMARRPEYMLTGVDEETGCAWGIFRDGRSHLVTNNFLPAAPGGTGFAREAAPAAPAATVLSKALGAELPKSSQARVFHSFGPGFPGAQEVVSDLRRWLGAKGFTLAAADARLSGLRTVSGDGFFYFHTHGGASRYVKEKGTQFRMYSIQSASLASDELDRTPEVADDFANARLTYFSAPNGETVIEDGKEVNVSDTRYGITANFVSRYWSFAQDSVVFVNACHSAEATQEQYAIAFAGACTRTAGAYLGWTDTVNETGAYAAPRYFVDRLLGLNDATQAPESPKQRAFAWDRVLQDMAAKGKDTDPVTGARLIGKPGALGRTSLLAPAIHHLDVDERGRRLVLAGDFGSKVGEVMVNGTRIPVSSWSAERIECELRKPAEPGSHGGVYVRIDDHRSNVRWLTMWTTRMKYAWVELTRPGLRVDGQATLYHRADVGQLRDAPAQDPSKPLRYAAAQEDSLLHVQASGAYSTGACTYSWSGAMDFPAVAGTGTLQLLSYMFVDTTSRKGAFGLALAAPAPGLHEAATCGGSADFMPAWDTLDGDEQFAMDTATGQMLVPLPALRFTCDEAFRIPARSFDNGDGMTLSWTEVVPAFPPTPLDEV